MPGNVHDVQSIEVALGAVSLFAHLRPDEIGRIARRFEVIELAANTSRQFAAQPEQARLIIVVSGSVNASVDDPTGEVQVRMRPGDRYGDAMLFTGNPRPIRITARSPSLLAAIDRANVEQLLKEYPAVALPLSAELASELRARDEQVRQVAELRTSGRNSKQIAAAVQRLRRVLVLRSAGVRRPTTSGLFRRLVIDQGAEPPFWMLLGFILGLCGARLVVHLILKYKLEQHFFALVGGEGANPMHIHHFNYGLILVGATGVLALSPYGRRALRALSMAFGLGCGLVVDEFALFWNLNPDYSQGLSLISAAIALVALVQVAYFRRFWLAFANRAVQRIRGE